MAEKKTGEDRAHYPSSRFGANQKFTENGQRKSETDDEGRKSDSGGYGYQDQKNQFGTPRTEGMDSDEGYDPPQGEDDFDLSELHGLEREKNKKDKKEKIQRLE